MAFLGIGTTFTFAGNTFQVTNLEPPGASVESLDVTVLSSANYTREKLAGLITEGQITIEVLADGTRPTLRTNGAFSMTFPTTPSRTCSGTAFISGFKPSVPVGGLATATITFEVVGPVAWS